MTLRLRLLAALLPLALLFVTPAARAVDGVTLISQATVATGLPGCNSTGFPIMICQPGSYRFSGNIEVPNTSTDAITIMADHVTIDLNGFTLAGPAGGASGGASGISAFNHNGIAIENGEVTAFGFGVALTGSDETVRSLRLDNVGIAVGITSGTVADTSVTGASYGIIAQNGAALIENNNIDGGLEGIEIDSVTSVTNASILNNIVTNESIVGILYLNGASGGYGGNTLENNNSNVSGGTSMNNNVCGSGGC